MSGRSARVSLRPLYSWFWFREQAINAAFHAVSCSSISGKVKIAMPQEWHGYFLLSFTWRTRWTWWTVYLLQD